MANEKRFNRFLKSHRNGAAAVTIMLAVAMLAAPILIISLSPGGWSSWLSSSVRLLALLSFTLIFMNIVTGALAPYFYIIFKPKPEYVIHLLTGSLGFLLALSHGLIVITQRYYQGFGALWVIGPVALALMVLAVWVALDRARLKRAWRVIHQVNYVIFVAIYIKAVVIGTDFKMGSGASWATMILFTVYLAAAAIALALRLRRYQHQAARRKASLAHSTPAPEPDAD